MGLNEEEDVKPVDLKIKYREKEDHASKSSQTSTFKTKQERTKNDVVAAAENELSSHKREPKSNVVCIHQVELNLSRHWDFYWKCVK